MGLYRRELLDLLLGGRYDIKPKVTVANSLVHLGQPQTTEVVRHDHADLVLVEADAAVHHLLRGHNAAKMQIQAY